MDDFRNAVTQIVQRGVSRKNRWRVTIPLPDGIFDENAVAKSNKNPYENATGLLGAIQTGFNVVNAFFGGKSSASRSLQALCSMAAFPGVSIDTTAMNNDGNHIKMANSISQSDIDFTFILANDFFEKQVLDSWRKLVYDPHNIKMGYWDDYTVDIILEQLDSEDNPVHRMYITGAYPINFESIILDKGAADQYHQYTVSFTFNHMMSDTEYQQRNISSDFLPIGIADALATGDWETAASKAGQLYRKIKQGNFTGEALLVYKQLDQLVRNMAGISIQDFERISIGIQRDILGNSQLSATEKSNLLSLLKDVVR